MLAMADNSESKPKRSRPPFWATRNLIAITGWTSKAPEPGPEGVAEWFVLLVTPGHEDAVGKHLAGRGFGIYLPKRRANIDGTTIEACHPAPELAGYVLVKLWYGNISRARRCPGVTGVLSHPDGRPVQITESDVLKIRYSEAATDAALVHMHERREAKKKQAAEAVEQREKARKSKKKSKAEKKRRKLERRRARRTFP
jgi:hypothetical protein